MIRDKFPLLSDADLKLLSKKTAGLYGAHIFSAVEEYIENREILNKSKFKYRNPETGEYPEFEFNPYKLKNELLDLGFDAKVIPPKYPGAQNLKAIVAKIIYLFYLASIFIAPSFEILAQKE